MSRLYTGNGVGVVTREPIAWIPFPVGERG